jgi:hypothetical protein
MTILWIICLVDVIFHRHDLVWWKRLGWFLLILVPLIGPIIYAFTTPIFDGRRDSTGQGFHLMPTPRPEVGMGQQRFIT